MPVFISIFHALGALAAALQADRLQAVLSADSDEMRVLSRADGVLLDGRHVDGEG